MRRESVIIHMPDWLSAGVRGNVVVHQSKLIIVLMQSVEVTLSFFEIAFNVFHFNGQRKHVCEYFNSNH